MNREREIKILMKTGCTQLEADKHLKDGAVIMNENEVKAFFEVYISQLDPDEATEERAKFDEMLKGGKAVLGLEEVTEGNEKFYINYSL